MAYKTTLGIESPEPSEPPAATGQLKKAFEQVDALLRKQLTTLVELAKLKVTEKLEAVALTVTGTLVLPGESITEAMLKKEVVTDAKVVTGRALVETGNKYTTKTYTTTEAKAGITPSTTRSAIVTLVSYLVSGGPLSATFKVGAGAAITVEGTGGTYNTNVPLTVLTGPGEVWKLETESAVESIIAYTKIL